jgi:recombination protein RecA
MGRYVNMSSKWMSKLTKELGVAASDLKKDKPKVVASWSPSLNWATAAGGFTAGKVNICYGPESAGKSMLAMMAIIELQRHDPEALAIWFDAEYSFNIGMFEKLGGDPTRLVVRPSNDPVTIFDYLGGDIKEMLQDGAPIKAIVIDSIKSIRYPKDVRKQTTDMIMGGAGSAYLGSALKMIIPIIAEFKLLTFFIQQVSANMDPMKALRNPYIISEGHALKHCADLMLEITRVDSKKGSIESGETITGAAAQIGHKVRVKVKKNRLGAPARQAEFTFHYDSGIINTEDEIYELGKSLNVIKHPVNPDTGKENPQMWQFSNYPAVRGDAAMRQNVCSNKKMQDEIMLMCYTHQDAKVVTGADGFVEDTLDDDLI